MHGGRGNRNLSALYLNADKHSLQSTTWPVCVAYWAFSLSATLTTFIDHMLSHSGERRFSCDKCHDRFTTPGVASRHRAKCTGSGGSTKRRRSASSVASTSRLPLESWHPLDHDPSHFILPFFHTLTGSWLLLHQHKRLNDYSHLACFRCIPIYIMLSCMLSSTLGVVASNGLQSLQRRRNINLVYLLSNYLLLYLASSPHLHYHYHISLSMFNWLDTILHVDPLASHLFVHWSRMHWLDTAWRLC